MFVSAQRVAPHGRQPFSAFAVENCAAELTKFRSRVTISLERSPMPEGHSSSGSTVPFLFAASFFLADAAALSSRSLFYPIHDIGFVYPENLFDSTPAYPAVVHFYCQFPSLFWIGVLLRVDRIDDAALLTLAALGSRCITPYFALICGLPALRGTSSMPLLLLFSCLLLYHKMN